MAAGQVLVSPGSTLTTQQTILGNTIFGPGTVNVLGGGASFDAGLLTIGNGGSGTLNIGGTASATSAATDIGVQVTSVGAASLTDSAWTISDTLRIGLAGQGSLTAGAPPPSSSHRNFTVSPASLTVSARFPYQAARSTSETCRLASRRPDAAP